MKRISGVWLLQMIVLTLAVQFGSGEAWAEKRVSILMFSDETRYSDAAKGIMDQLKEEGMGYPKIKYTIEHAGANKAKAAEMVQKAVAEKPDLICSMGTSMTMAISREIKDIPIVFSVVYDPVEAGIAKGWKSSGNNTTGVSTKIPMQQLMDRMREVAPVKRLAVLYTPGEKNSETQLKDLQSEQADNPIKVIPVPLARKEDISDILQDVIRTSDALYLTGSNLVDSQVTMIADMATRAGVVTITHLDDLVAKGVLIGVSANSYQLGRLAGGKAARILKGEKPSAIPIETLKKFDVILNRKTAKEGRFTIPPEFMKSVTRSIQ